MTDYEATAIKVTIGNLVLQGSLGTTSTARDLVAQSAIDPALPRSERRREVRGPATQAVAGRPEPDDIGYYAPGGNLVFYYGDVGYWPGIVRIGSFDTGVHAIADIADEFVATVDLAA